MPPTTQPHLLLPLVQFGHCSPFIFIPSASMSIFNVLSVILLIPVYDKLVEPLVRRCGHKITMLQRIGAGGGVEFRAAGPGSWALGFSPGLCGSRALRV